MKYLLASLAIIASIAFAAPAAAEDLVQARLIDRLDRPRDGYCFDILGVGTDLVLDVPLFAHNCKLGLTADSALIYTEAGELFFPQPEVCVTAFGVKTVLPGSAVMVEPCGRRSPFYYTSDLQKFDHLENGQLQLRGRDVCIAVGAESDGTYSSSDLWRVLSMEPCAEVPLNLSAWEFSVPD
ncbi:MAG: hypothetical protein MPK06_00710 [Alphaproteobacteria bacterium]|nr:hypothetical protein [Alphaproteobacteria bacterium]MDA8003458.1 hypothetical protein [Alphaproteobacteria bacterium]MDA8005058.1 hypothetical protein [Alphaproteobacteria bacterium]MDA8012474.1 hypothetical protein [Alphaproteobacteria bacterium]